MSVLIRKIFAFPSWVYKPFVNQNGRVAIGDVDGKTYIADEYFFMLCEKAEQVRNLTIPLREEEIRIEDAESREVTEWELSGETAGREEEIFSNGKDQEGSAGSCS